MNREDRCPQCGAELAGDAPQGLCPACLLKRGLDSQTAGGDASRPDSASHAPPAPAELAPLFPDLEILELLGRGGMGVVYKARQKRLDRLVALKILSPAVGKDPAFADRFAREARAMAMLNHPHIVAVYDFGQAGDVYYFLMEFVDGLNLRRLLDTSKLAPKEALAIVPQICVALQYAHDKGVVHRDIKPENVLVDKNGQVKIADFGLAKLMGREAKDFSLTGVGQVMGTPNYMAPEQIEHPQDVDHRADIYSLGVVFYQMLTGELPIGRFASPSKKVRIDARLDEIVLRALEKEPSLRYQQASEVKTEVESIATTPAQVMPVVGRHNGKNVIKWSGIAVRFFIALSAGVVYGAAFDLRTGVMFGLVLLLALMAARILTALAMPTEMQPQLAGTARPQAPRPREAIAAGREEGAWRSPDSGWGWLVGKIFGITFTSPLAYHCANLSALGFVGILYAVGYASPDLHWCFRFWGLFGFFGLIGVAHVIEAFSRSGGRRSARPWLRKTFVFLAVVLAFLIIVRTFFAEAFVVPGDCAAPEVPRGSRVLAWKVGNTFVPHDLIVYRFDGQTNLGRVVRNEGADLIVNRNGQPDFHVSRDAVTGKVICVYWRASAAAPADSGKGADRVPETPRAGGQATAPTAAAPNKKNVPETLAAVARGVPKVQGSQKAQDERIDLLQKALKIVNAQYRSGNATANECLAASAALLEAQLGAAKTKAERLAILQRLLDDRRDFEKVAQARFESGTCSEADYLRARAASSEAAIRLAAEKAEPGQE
jgi:predicted Ser/Thr protein kinase